MNDHTLRRRNDQLAMRRSGILVSSAIIKKMEPEAFASVGQIKRFRLFILPQSFHSIGITHTAVTGKLSEIIISCRLIRIVIISY